MVYLIVYRISCLSRILPASSRSWRLIMMDLDIIVGVCISLPELISTWIAGCNRYDVILIWTILFSIKLVFSYYIRLSSYSFCNVDFISFEFRYRYLVAYIYIINRSPCSSCKCYTPSALPPALYLHIIIH